MIKSMTGFGRAQKIIGDYEIVVELRSVNHRYFEFSARVPRVYAFLEERLKNYIKTAISRGKIEAYVTVTPLETTATTQVKINTALANSYLAALRTLSQELNLPDDMTVSKLARFSDIFLLSKVEENEETIWNAVQETAQEAMERFVSMREIEGEKMDQDLQIRLNTIESWVTQIEEQAPQTVQAYQERLLAKLKEVLANTSLDEQRILTEAAIFADKIAVDEETVRLKSHIRQFREILQSQEPVGRKLDFLVQEMNRETNTIGSKAQNMNISKIVVDMKSEIEKIREQIQNIE